jgi:parafibromin
MYRFEPSEVARQNEVAQGNIKPDDVVPILRKRTGTQGESIIVMDKIDADL